MTEAQQLALENQKLLNAHGDTGGKPTYQWIFSEDLLSPFRKREHNGKLATKFVQTKGGIWAVEPVFELRKQMPQFDRQWILCRFRPPVESESQWISLYGNTVEWRPQGYYMGTEVVLDPGYAPWDCCADGTTFTDVIIRLARKERSLKPRDVENQTAAEMEAQEKAADRRRNDAIDDLLLPFPKADHVPGKRGMGVSFGGVTTYEEK